MGSGKQLDAFNWRHRRARRALLTEKLNNFRAKIGIQTADSDVEVADSPVSPSTGTGVAYVTTVSKNFFDFDPTAATNGNIATKAFFRIGVLHSSTDATISRGEVIVRVGFRHG